MGEIENDLKHENELSEEYRRKRIGQIQKKGIVVLPKGKPKDKKKDGKK